MMNKNVLTGLIALSISVSVMSQCVTNTSNIYTFTYNGDSYEIVKENLNWIDAAACAVERGGILSEINTQEEQDSVFFQVNNAGISASSTVAPDGGGASYLWLGGNDMLTEGDWVWNGNNDTGYVQFWLGKANGSVVNGLYNNWGNEPDDFGGSQDALGLAFTNWPLGNAGQWNDVDKVNDLYYIIEYKSTPLTINTLNPESMMKVFPNPSAGVFQITFSEEIVNYREVEVFSIEGKLLRNVSVPHASKSLIIENLESGIYLVKLIQDRNVMQVSKVIITK